MRSVREIEIGKAMLKLHAPAKVNLFLRILAQERSGFHQLETLFAALDFGDLLKLEVAPAGVSLETDGLPMGPPEENLVYRAAIGFLSESGVERGVRIHLHKRIPMGAGLGGGSSDAAATLLGLDALFPGRLRGDELLHLAGRLGSDVPFFLSPSPLALAWGRGDRLLPLMPLPSAPVLLALPPIAIRTPEAYGVLARDRESGEGERTSRMYSPDAFTSWQEVASVADNDFEAPVFRTYPVLGEIRKALEDSGAVFSLLSGSGAALFGLFGNDAAATLAKTALSRRFPNTRFVATRTSTSLEGSPNAGGGVEPQVGD